MSIEMAAELELKLEIAPESTPEFKRVMQNKGWIPANELMLANCYYDTPQQELKRARIALRVRRAGELWIQTLKTAGSIDADGISHRGEWEWQLPTSALDTQLLGELLPQDIDPGSLKPLFTTDFKRTTWLVDYQGAHIEVALDQGEIFVAPKRVPISEVELELKSGPPAALVALANTLQTEIELRVSTLSKAERAQQLLAAQAAAEKA